MAEPYLIAPPPVSTPAQLKRSGGRSRSLPDDLLRAASLRLGVMSLLFAVLWTVGVVAGHLAEHAINPGSQRWLQFDTGDGIAVAAVIVSLALFAYTRKGERDPRFLLDLGLGYMVFTSLSLGLVFHLGGVSNNAVILPQISWIGAVVLMFAAIVPTTPKKMLIAGLIAVSMNPIGMLISIVGEKRRRRNGGRPVAPPGRQQARHRLSIQLASKIRRQRSDFLRADGRAHGANTRRGFRNFERRRQRDLSRRWKRQSEC